LRQTLTNSNNVEPRWAVIDHYEAASIDTPGSPSFVDFAERMQLSHGPLNTRLSQSALGQALFCVECPRNPLNRHPPLKLRGAWDG
jgi:hypothetical protein